MSSPFFDDEDEFVFYKKPESELDYYKRRCYELEAKVEELEDKYTESVNLAMSLSQASDYMKLQLILCGALTIPKGEGKEGSALSEALPSPDPVP